MTGKVYLVGAGPGDPGLITVKGMQALKQAQVVVYDRLVDPVLLQAVSEENIVAQDQHHPPAGKK